MIESKKLLVAIASDCLHQRQLLLMNLLTVVYEGKIVLISKISFKLIFSQ